VGAVAAGEFADSFDPFVAAFGDHVGGAKVTAEVGAFLVPAHQEDSFGAEPFGG
jgi:hypothetical protein